MSVTDRRTCAASEAPSLSCVCSCYTLLVFAKKEQQRHEAEGCTFFGIKVGLKLLVEQNILKMCAFRHFYNTNN